MSSPVVLLFAGQGAQKVGMGHDLVEAFPSARLLFEQANDILGFDLTTVMFAGPEERLTRTDYCQPALYVHGLACLAVLREKVPALRIAACAGLSLGEFTAHAAAGTFSFADGLELVAARGRFMEEACAEREGGMVAMIGGEESAVRELAADCDVDVANYNAPGQIVLSGSKEGIARATQGAREKGIRLAKPLAVAGAYHSRLMRSAQEKLSAKLASTTLLTATCPVVANVTARPVGEPSEIQAALAAQVTGSVRWAESMQWLRTQGHELFVELGPGGTLAGLMNRIDKSARVLSITDVPTMEQTAAALGVEA